MLRRRYVPSYYFREADGRALLAALVHPPGACPGVFGAHDLVADFAAADAQQRPTQSGLDEATGLPDETTSSTRSRARSSVTAAFAPMRSAIKHAKRKRALTAPTPRRDATARSLTSGVFGGLWFVRREGDALLTPAQRRAARLERLHLTEDIEECWEERVRDRSYEPCARLLMAVILGWLLAVAATAALAYLSYVLERYVERRLRWLGNTLAEVDDLLGQFVDPLSMAGSNATTSEGLVDAVAAALEGDAARDDVAAVVKGAVGGAVGATATAAAALANASFHLNATNATSYLANETATIEARYSSRAVERTEDALSAFERRAARTAASLASDRVDQWRDYVVDYRDVVAGWHRVAEEAQTNIFKCGIGAAAVAFILMNYSLHMIMTRFREMTCRMRETGKIDDMDLIIDESLARPNTRSERFWMLLTAPSAPYAVAFVGMAVSNMIIISLLCFAIVFLASGFALFPGATRRVYVFVIEQIGGWFVIYPIVYRPAERERRRRDVSS